MRKKNFVTCVTTLWMAFFYSHHDLKKNSWKRSKRSSQGCWLLIYYGWEIQIESFSWHCFKWEAKKIFGVCDRLMQWEYIFEKKVFSLDLLDISTLEMSIYNTLIVQELKQSLFSDIIMFNQESRVYYLIKKLGHILYYVTGE